MCVCVYNMYIHTYIPMWMLPSMHQFLDSDTALASAAVTVVAALHHSSLLVYHINSQKEILALKSHLCNFHPSTALSLGHDAC